MSGWVHAFARVLILVLPVSAAAQGAADIATESGAGTDYWTDSWRGWHFYEDPSPPEKPAARTATPPAPHDAKAPELKELATLRKAIEDSRTIAVMNPTEANVRRYMEVEAYAEAKASRFADVAQRVAWVTPDLNPTLSGRPGNALGMEVYDRGVAQARAHTVGALAHDHVLLFFFRSDCPYCHRFAPILAALEARYGITVVPISVDGGGLPQYPAPRLDNGIAATLKVSMVPAVFLAQPYAGTITPIGYGLMSEDELLERIATLSAPMPPDTLSVPPPAGLASLGGIP